MEDGSMRYITVENDKDFQHTNQARNTKQALGFYIDAVERSERDRETYPNIFGDAELLDRVEFVKDRVKEFFGKTDRELYVTCRYNRGNSFISVKPDVSLFSRRSRTEKYELLLNPIRSLGGYIQEKNTSSGWFVRVYYKNQQEAK
jgi:hypothetical protein